MTERLQDAAGKACVALHAAWGSVHEAPAGDVSSTLVAIAESPDGRDAGSEAVLRAVTRACVTRADKSDIPDSVARLLEAARDAAPVLGLSRRAVSATVMRTAMRHPRLRGDLGDHVLGDLLRGG